MHQLEDGRRVYSHSSLDLWRLCKRRWHRRYVRGIKEETSANMAAGTWLAQEPVEAWENLRLQGSVMTNLPDVTLDACWANFLAEFGGNDDYDSPMFDKELAPAVLRAYQANPVPGKVVAIEEMLQVELAPGVFYQGKPDFVVEQVAGSQVESWEPFKDRDIISRIAWDIKLKTFNQARVGDDYFMKPAIHPFDDQGYGQAALAGCESFGQIQFFLGKKDGILHGPYYIEQPINPILMEEWKDETVRTVREIESYLLLNERVPWPKNPQACGAFGRTCSGYQECQFGWVHGGAR